MHPTRQLPFSSGQTLNASSISVVLLSSRLNAATPAGGRSVGADGASTSPKPMPLGKYSSRKVWNDSRGRWAALRNAPSGVMATIAVAGRPVPAPLYSSKFVRLVQKRDHQRRKALRQFKTRQLFGITRHLFGLQALFFPDRPALLSAFLLEQP